MQCYWTSELPGTYLPISLNHCAVAGDGEIKVNVFWSQISLKRFRLSAKRKTGILSLQKHADVCYLHAVGTDELQRVQDVNCTRKLA